MSREGGSAQLNLPGMPSVELMLPASEGGESETGNFYPIDAGTVLDALAQVRYPRPVDQIEVYLLPYPRKSTPTSSALGRRLFLSPASSPTHENVIHMVTVHELGHLFQYERMPDLREDLWDEYRRLRGIENGDVYNENAAHADPVHCIPTIWRASFTPTTIASPPSGDAAPCMTRSLPMLAAFASAWNTEPDQTRCSGSLAPDSRQIAVPSPPTPGAICPSALSPQQYISPEVVRAQVCFSPPSTAATSAR